MNTDRTIGGAGIGKPAEVLRAVDSAESIEQQAAAYAARSDRRYTKRAILKEYREHIRGQRLLYGEAAEAHTMSISEFCKRFLRIPAEYEVELRLVETEKAEEAAVMDDVERRARQAGVEVDQFASWQDCDLYLQSIGK